MDTTNCPIGYATDRVFSVVHSGQALCGDSIKLFWVCIFIFIIFADFLIDLLLWKE
jgi:hypothetical protein